MIGRGVTAIINRGGDESKVQAFLRGLQEETILPNTDDIKKWLDTNVGKVGTGDNPYETVGEVLAPGGYVKGAKSTVKGVKSLAPVAGEMIENYAAKTGLTQFALPRVDSINRFSVGPSSIKPKVIAENKPLYRETNIDGLTDLLREDKQFSYSNAFVTDNPDIAIGQGANTGVVVKFRPNSVSGAENKKPMTGDLAGREYKADVLAPKSIESITFAKESDLKKVRSLAAQVLRTQFDRVTDGGKGITFVRKATSAEGTK
jgi:hypothetical protein